MKLYTLKFFILMIFMFQTTIIFSQNGTFTIDGQITGFTENQKLYLIDGTTNALLDSTSIIGDRITFSGISSKEPRSLILYIPLENSMKYAFVYIADENVSVEGNINDFPDNVKVQGSVHHSLMEEYNSRIAPFNDLMNIERSKMLSIQRDHKWNDSLQKAYLSNDGILGTIDQDRTQEEILFINDHLNTYYALQVLHWKRTKLTDKNLKKIFSKFSKNLKNSTNGKAIQNYLKNPDIQIRDRYIDFEALDRSGNRIKFSELFDDACYLLLDFSTPTCQFSKASIQMLQQLQTKHGSRIKIVTFYTGNNKEQYESFSNTSENKWDFLWTTNGEAGFPYVRYRVNSTPSYFLFDPSGRLVDKWSGFQQGYYDATQLKIEHLIGQ